MRCIFTNRTIEIECFSIGTYRTIGTNGDPSYHHQHQWSLFVSIGQPSMILYSIWVLLKETSPTSRGQNQGKEASADREEGNLRAPRNATFQKKMRQGSPRQGYLHKSPCIFHWFEIRTFRCSVHMEPAA